MYYIKSWSIALILTEYLGSRLVLAYCRSYDNI